MSTTTVVRASRLRPLGISLATAMIVTLAPSSWVLGPALATTTSPAVGSAAVWGDCPTDVQVINADGIAAKCTTITVPMDYANPSAGTFDLLATGFFPTSTPKGVIFGNPGGPGSSALDFWGASAGTPKQMYRDYALIGLQPRGLEHAVSAVCRTLEECENTADAAYRKTLTTENVARDMDELRKAMGVGTISYYGASWGTKLGATYATLFPRNVDKMVLDSSIDPTDGIGSSKFQQARQEVAFERRLYDFFEWAATKNDVLQLGDTPYKVYSAWNTARLLKDPGSWTLNYLPPQLRENDLPEILRPRAAAILPDLNIVVQGMSRRDYVERFTAAVAAGQASQDGNQFTPSQIGDVTKVTMYDRRAWSALAAIIDMTLRPIDLGALQKAIAAGTVDPRLLADLTAASGAKAQVGSQAGLAGFQGTWVNVNGGATVDDAAAANPDPALIRARDAAQKEYEAAIAAGDSTPAVNAKRLIVGAYDMMIGGFVNPAAQYSGAGLTTAPLLLQSLLDPATTAPGAPLLADRLGGALITVEGGDHGVFRRGNTVIDQAVLDYLAGGSVTITHAPETAANATNILAPIRKALADIQGGPAAPVVGPTIPDTPLNRILSILGPNVDANSVVPKPVFAGPDKPTADKPATAPSEPAPAITAAVPLTNTPLDSAPSETPQTAASSSVSTSTATTDSAVPVSPGSDTTSTSTTGTPTTAAAATPSPTGSDGTSAAADRGDTASAVSAPGATADTAAQKPESSGGSVSSSASGT